MKNWCDEMPQLSNISVPHYFPGVVNRKVDSLELHLISDSRTGAYGTITYLCVKTSDDDVNVGFVT